MFLQHLGLDEEAELIYRAILAHPMATVEEIQQVTGLGQAETLEVLDRLARLALVNWNGQGPRRGPAARSPSAPSRRCAALANWPSRRPPRGRA
jgi:hypothetical protein